jgi:hypothetical protein
MNPRADILVEEELQNLAAEEQERDDLIDIEFLIQERDELLKDMNKVKQAQKNLSPSVTAPDLAAAAPAPVRTSTVGTSPLERSASLDVIDKAYSDSKSCSTCSAIPPKNEVVDRLEDEQRMQADTWLAEANKKKEQQAQRETDRRCSRKYAYEEAERQDRERRRVLAEQNEIKRKADEEKAAEEKKAEEAMLYAEKVRAAKQFLARGRELSVSRSTASLRVRYELGDKFGAGAFGEVYYGTDITNGDRVAVKTEALSAEHPQLVGEYKIYTRLQGGLGFPDVRFFGVENDSYNMVLDLLGDSLQALLNKCGGRYDGSMFT